MSADTQVFYKERILCALLHIQRHLDEELELEALARIAHFSPFHFHRLFRSLVGESLKEHVRRLRLERAAIRLRYSDDPVIQVALDAGFQTHESFTRAFGSRFGCPPSQYRKAQRERMFAPSPSGVHYAPHGELESFHPLKPGGKHMDVRIESRPALRVLFARGTGPYGTAAREAWAQLCAWAGPRGLLGPQTRYIGLSHDDPAVTPPERIRYDACITFTGEPKPEGDIGVQEIAGGSYAVTLHKGPLETLHETWDALCAHWLLQSPHRLRESPSYEVYLTDPESTPPEEQLTEICAPIEESRG